MASYTEVVFSGTTDFIPVPFPYLDKSHVRITLNGTLLGPSEYNWVSAGQVVLTAGYPPSGTKGVARRVTPTTPLTTFYPGNLDTRDLNIAALQPLYLAEEARDIAADAGSGTGGNGGTGGGGDYEAPVQVGDTFPANPKEGQLFYNTTDGVLYIYRNGQWVRVVPNVTPRDIQDGLYSYGLRPIEYLTELPTTGNVEGRVVFNTTDNKLRKYSGSAWADIAVNTSIGPNSITTDMLVANSVTAGKIQAGAVGADQVAANAITAAKLAANSVTAAAIQAGVIATDKIAALAVTAAQLAAGAVTADKIAANAITAGKIDAGVITASHIKAQTITANNIQDGAITAAKAGTFASRWPSVDTRTSLASMLFPCTPGAARLITFSTQLTDESSNGVPNATTKPVQGVYELEIDGQVVFRFDSFSAAATTCLHSVTWCDWGTTRRNDFLIFEVFGKGVPYMAGERTKVGFRSPTLAVMELKK